MRRPPKTSGSLSMTVRSASTTGVIPASVVVDSAAVVRVDLVEEAVELDLPGKSGGAASAPRPDTARTRREPPKRSTGRTVAPAMVRLVEETVDLSAAAPPREQPADEKTDVPETDDATEAEVSEADDADTIQFAAVEEPVTVEFAAVEEPVVLDEPVASPAEPDRRPVTVPATAPDRKPLGAGRLRKAPALDGLRGIAVLAVVVYHLFHDTLPGGYLGVDIFFVLSGFLITSLLVREYGARGGISLGGFWTRRARRILPASIVVLLCATAVAGLVGGDVDVKLVPQFFSSLFFVNNWVQIAESQSYFADTTPRIFMHYWSLAIEEQFYV
ncbi:MAG: acyltransferase family protein, partial [Gordonia sp. (in: high G+C Gram-positive bacteria)]